MNPQAPAPAEKPNFEFQGSSFAPPEPSFIWRGFKVVVGLAAETPLSAIGMLILAIVLQVLLPPLAGCFFSLSLSTIASKFIWKILLLFRFEALDTLGRAALRFQQEHPYLQLVAAIAAVGLAVVSAIASILAAAALGVFNGIVAEANHRYMLIEKKRQEQAAGKPQHLTEILIS
jgi:hypothetical protein